MDLLARGAKKLGIDLSPHQLEQFQLYYRELMAWNTRINLTSITTFEEVQVKHFLDSLTPVLAFPRGSLGTTMPTAIDVGSGGGFPGIPLKVAFPDLEVTLVESTQKKAKFLKYLVERLGLTGVGVVAARAEEIAHDSRYREGFPVVLARALSPLPTLAELTLPFCSIGGALVALKKGDISAEVGSSSRIIVEAGGRLRELVKVELEDLGDDRCLVVVDKLTSTPDMYPRRAGIPAKKPILG